MLPLRRPRVRTAQTQLASCPSANPKHSQTRYPQKHRVVNPSKQIRISTRQGIIDKAPPNSPSADDSKALTGDSKASIGCGRAETHHPSKSTTSTGKLTECQSARHPIVHLAKTDSALPFPPFPPLSAAIASSSRIAKATSCVPTPESPTKDVPARQQTALRPRHVQIIQRQDKDIQTRRSFEKFG